MSALLYFTSFGILLLSSVLWMQGRWHCSAVKTGLAIAPGPSTAPLFAGLSEIASKRRIPVGVIAAFGCALSAVGAVLLLSSIGNSSHYAADFLPGWLLVCIGFAWPCGTRSQRSIETRVAGSRRRHAAGAACARP